MGSLSHRVLTSGAWCVLLLALTCWAIVVHSVWSGKSLFATGSGSGTAFADGPSGPLPVQPETEDTTPVPLSRHSDGDTNDVLPSRGGAAKPTHALPGRRGGGDGVAGGIPQRIAVALMQKRARDDAVQRVLAVLSGATPAMPLSHRKRLEQQHTLGQMLGTLLQQRNDDDAPEHRDVHHAAVSEEIIPSMPHAVLLLRAAMCQTYHLLTSPLGDGALTLLHRDDSTNEGCATTEAVWNLTHCQRHLKDEGAGIAWVGALADGTGRVHLKDDATVSRLREIYVYHMYRKRLAEEARRSPIFHEVAANISASRSTASSGVTLLNPHRLAVARQRNDGVDGSLHPAVPSAICVPREFANFGDDVRRTFVPSPTSLQESAVPPKRNATRATKWTAAQLRIAFLIDLSVALDVSVGALLHHMPALRRNATLVRGGRAAMVQRWRLPVEVLDAVLLGQHAPHPASSASIGEGDEINDDTTANSRSNHDPSVDEADSAILRARTATTLRALTKLCMAPKLRAILSFSSRRRWLLPLSPPPLVESDVVDRLHYEPGESVMANVTLSLVANRKKPLSTKSLGGRNRPVFYTMGNVVLSSRSGPHEKSGEGGGPLQGYGTTSAQHLDLMRDESFEPVADVVVEPRRLEPRFVVRSVRPLFLLPVGPGGDSLVRVVFRYISAITLLRRMGMHHDAAIFAYMVLPSAPASSMGERSFYRTFFHSVHGPWLSFVSPASPTAQEEDVLDLAFRFAVTGFDGISRSHKATVPVPVGSAAETELMLFRKNALQRLKPAAMVLRQSLADCFQLPSTALKRMRLLPPPLIAATYPQPQVTTPATAHAAVQIVVIGGEGLSIVNATARVQSFLQSLRAADNRVEAHALLVPDFDALTVAQQAAIARSADILVGPQGASAFSLMLLMKPHSVAVTVMHPPMAAVGTDAATDDAHGCAGVGINNPHERLGCDFAKLAAAAHVHQIGFVAAAQTIDGGGLVVGTSDFTAWMDAALCCLGKRDEIVAAAECSSRQQRSSGRAF